MNKRIVLAFALLAIVGSINGMNYNPAEPSTPARFGSSRLPQNYRLSNGGFLTIGWEKPEGNKTVVRVDIWNAQGTHENTFFEPATHAGDYDAINDALAKYRK